MNKTTKDNSSKKQIPFDEVVKTLLETPPLPRKDSKNKNEKAAPKDRPSDTAH